MVTEQIAADCHFPRLRVDSVDLDNGGIPILVGDEHVSQESDALSVGTIGDMSIEQPSLKKILEQAQVGGYQEPVVNLEIFAELLDLMGDPEFIIQLVGDFTADLDKRLVALVTAIEAGDTGIVEHESHSLKSSSGSVGAARLSHLCAAIELSARGGKHPSGPHLVAVLKRSADEARVALNEAVATIPQI